MVHNAVPGPESVVGPRSQLDGEIRLLYVGRLSHRKGPQVLVTAMGLLRRRGVATRLDIVGAVFPGNEAYEDELRALVEHHGLTENVRFHGFQRSVWPYLAECDIAVVPSVADESFGNTAVEASLAARPVVVSEIAGLKEATSESEAAVLVSPGDPGELADAVERIALDWSRYSELAKRDADRTAQAFSSAVYGRGLVAALGLGS